MYSAPPDIVYSLEYTITSEDDYGKPGQVACAVHNSPTTATHVYWWSNGRQLENGNKYHMDSVPINDEQGLEHVVKYRLTVNDLQVEDIGDYLCQVSSDYREEDSHSAWIKVDYRKGRHW